MARKGLVVGMCVLGFAGMASAAPETSVGKRASLQVMETRPFAVRGVGFRANERVHVHLAVNGRSQGKVKIAGASGGFTVKFSASLHACGRYTLRAFGSRGSHAWVLPRRPQLDCMPPEVEYVGRYYPDSKATS